MPHLALHLSFSTLLLSLFIPAALTADLQAGVNRGGPNPALFQGTQPPPSAPILIESKTSASQTPPSSIPLNGDPCGPAHQDTPNYPNTCNSVPALTETPSAYGINCTTTIDLHKYPNFGTQWNNVEKSIESICTKMEDSRTMTGHWIWSQLAAGAALGFFLPPFREAAVRPSMQRCLQIYAAMNNTCATTMTASNIATVNMLSIPGYDPPAAGGAGMTYNYRSTGQPVNAGYISYIISSIIVAK